MSEERKVNLVLISIEEEGDEAHKDFVSKMAASFKLPEDKVEKIVESMPFVLSRNCSLDEARVMAEKVQDAGGICRLQDPEEEKQAQTSPEPAAEPSPAPEPASSPDDYDFDTEGPGGPGSEEPAPSEPAQDPSSGAGSIPLATPGSGGAAAKPAAGGGAGTVRCIECGESQPQGAATCQNCHFPLPDK